MATLKEWVRDFKKLTKWDKFSLLYGILIGIIGLILTNTVYNIYFKSNIDQPTFNAPNSSNFGIFYKSPNSIFQVTPIVETRIFNENCDSGIYKNKLTFTINKFFNKINSEGCGNFELPDLKYDLYNVKVVLPTKQELFMEKILSNGSYIIAYLNEDYSDACIVNKYKIQSNFDENDVCFIFSLGDNPCTDKFSLSRGPSFQEDRSRCYKKLSGQFDFLGEWGIKTNP
ncbi:hypothetical protein J4448_04005 [Candidatus Woesearchaeota archaeon]|nr:hypothetical protein [Candidatus Woesearchaeota archaeon]